MIQTKPNLKKIKLQAQSLIKKAGQSLLDDFKTRQTLKIDFKSDKEIVTSADLGAEKIILAGLKKITPNFHIISEESGDNQKKSDYTWFVDPLDGTTNFSTGNPLFGTMLTLVFKDEPIMTFIYLPYLKELYFAQKDFGAYLNDKKINVSDKPYPKSFMMFCHCAQVKQIKRATKIYQHFRPQVFDMRQIGSAAVEMAWIANGTAEAYVVPGANSWDIIGGVLLVREAGGQVYDFKGNLWTLKSKDICVTNGKVYPQMVKFLRTV